MGAPPPSKAATPEVAGEQQPAGARRHLLLARKYLSKGNYRASIRENETVLSLSSGTPPADEALFNLGLIYADPGYNNRNYQKSITYFRQVSAHYPQSEYARTAKILTEALHEIVRMRQSMTEALKENERLHKILEESKKIDVETEEKIRGKAR
jgi:tetratricopeptide (TPR) repeat protein